MHIIRTKQFVYVIGILIAFIHGVITAQYKIFPYKEIRAVKVFTISEIKRFTIGNVSAKAGRTLKNKPFTSNYYLRKK